MCCENQAFARQSASWSSVGVKHCGNVESVLQTVRRAGAHRFHEAILRLACKPRRYGPSNTA